MGLCEHPGTSQSLNFTQHLVHKQVAEKWAPRGQEPRGLLLFHLTLQKGLWLGSRLYPLSLSLLGRSENPESCPAARLMQFPMSSTQLRREASDLKETVVKKCCFCAEVGVHTLQKLAGEVRVISSLYMHIVLEFFFFHLMQ